MFRPIFVIAAFAFIAAFATTAHASERWRIVASHTLEGTSGHVVISLPSETTALKALRLYPREVLSQFILIENVVLVDRNGMTRKLHIMPVYYGLGTNSFAPASTGPFRIEFDYFGNRESATFDVWGAEPSAQAEEAPAADDFTLPWSCRAKTDPETGYATIAPVASFPLERTKGAHHQEVGILMGCGELRIGVEGQGLVLKEIVLSYFNDQTETIVVNAKLSPDGSTPWLALNGTEPIKAIDLAYDIAADVEEAPRVTIFARTTPAIADYVSKPDYAEKLKEYEPMAGPAPRAVGPQFDCVVANTCTPVQVFFGTNRQREDTPQRIVFGPERATDLALGSAIVTVPAAHGIGQVERPSYWSVRDLFNRLSEDPARHFVIVKDGFKIYATEDSFVAAVKAAMGELVDFKDQAFVFIHGFNVTFDDALYQTAQLTYDMGTSVGNKRVPFGLPFLFSWPARGGTFGLVQYETDARSAELAETHLRAFLELVVKRSGAKKVHLISHSMGNRVLLGVIDKIIQRQDPDLQFDQIVLAAPDVDRPKFITRAKRIGARLARSATPPNLPLANNVTLYVSANDRALALSRTYNHVDRAGDVPAGGPVVEDGIDTIDVSAVSTDVFATNHSTYASSSTLLNDISLMVRKGERPPDSRTPILRDKPLGTSLYWYYP